MEWTKQKRAMLVAIATVAVAMCAIVAPAQAEMAATLHAPANCVKKDAADGETTVDTERPFWFCNDGVPSNGGAIPGPGGTIANVGGLNAVTVPSAYSGFAGLPAKDPAPAIPGEDASDNIALDVDISLPDSAPPASGYPVIFMMHGCCSGNRTSWEADTVDASGEKWHYNNAWFASRGYVVVNYTSRGFVSNQSRGSTGETQLDSRSFEINDFQALACNVFDAVDGGLFEDVDGHTGADEINPDRVVATGGSYGGGFSWLALTDPQWTCNADTGADTQPMSLAAVAPRYGWTDLAYTLVPNGFHSQLPGDMPDFSGCDTGPRDLMGASCVGPAPVGTPVGMPKLSIVTLLFLSGNLPTGDHATFPPSIVEAFQCLQGSYPLGTTPVVCDNTLSTILPEFLRERSAYYQNDWFADIAANEPGTRVPVFNAGTLTDPLFPAYENRRMANRILDEVSDYPIKQYYGDYQHFVQNKAKEWGDLCGVDRHVCSFADYPLGDLNADPTTVVPGSAGIGVTTRLNKFIDNFALPDDGYGMDPGSVTQDVTAALQVCPENATGGQAADEAGERLTAPTFEDLTNGTLTVDVTADQTTTSQVAGNTHAENGDPTVNFFANGGRCRVETAVAGPGVASYTSDALAVDATMLGAAKVTIDFAATGDLDSLQLNSRLYDVLPSGAAVLVDRGPRRVSFTEAGLEQVIYELHGNGWRFPAGHRVRIEIAQDDEPFVRRSTPASATTISHVNVEIPTVEAGNVNAGGLPDPKPPPPSGGQPGSTGTSTTPTDTSKAKKCKKKKKKGKKRAAAAKKCKKKGK